MKSPTDFKMIVKMVFAIILMTLIGYVAMAIYPSPTPSISEAQQLLAHTFTGAVGALIGLIGGQRTASSP